MTQRIEQVGNKGRWVIRGDVDDLSVTSQEFGTMQEALEHMEDQRNRYEDIHKNTGGK